MTMIGFIENSTNVIERRFAYYLRNPKKYPLASEKEDMRSFLQSIARAERYNEIEDMAKYRELKKRILQSNILDLSIVRKALRDKAKVEKKQRKV